MTNHTCQLVFRASCLFGMTFAVAAAQSVPSPTTAEEEVVQLSPFVISDQADKGYLAKETLAGMRIKTDLKDAAAAIDVLTEKFLDDVGAVDMNQALKYLANMAYFDGSQNDVFNNSQWFSASYYSRGSGGNTVLVDFFPTGAVPIDRYNTENLTFLRGANTILFGIGSPSGVVSSSTKRAKQEKDLTSVRFMVDTWGSIRTELDVSRVLLKNRLAVRVAAVAGDQKTDQDPSLNRRQAVFGTVSYKPFKKTTLTVSGEQGLYYRYFTQSNVVIDAYTPWVSAGKPTINYITGKGMTDGSTTKGQFGQGIGSGLQNVSGASYLTYIDGSNLGVMDWRNMARGASWSGMFAAGAPGSGLPIAADRDARANTSFTEKTAFTDLRANTWSKLNPMDYDYSNLSIFWEQKVTRDLDFEVAYNSFVNEYLFTRGAGPTGNTIFVDPNEVLPDGKPNPYVGMPYLETGNGGNSPRRSMEWNKWDSFRSTVSYQLNLDRHKVFRNLGLGNYLFAGMYQDQKKYNNLQESRYVNVTPLPGNAATLNSTVNMISRRYYLRPGESSWGAYDGVPTFVQTGVPGATTSGPIKFEERNSGDAPRNSVVDTESFVAALQGMWWQSKKGYFHLTGMYGLRRDTQVSTSQTFTRQANGEYAAPVLNFNNLASYGTWNPSVEIRPRTKTYNVSYRPISQVRLFYNFSDVFQGAAQSFVDWWGKPLRSTIGKTKDYGIKLDLFGERVFLTATKYETGVFDRNGDNTAGLRGTINDIYDAMARPDLRQERPWTHSNQISEGYEFGLNASITRNWMARVTVGTQEATPSGIHVETAAYYDENRPLWRANASLPLLFPSPGYATVADAIARAEVNLADALRANGVIPRDLRKQNMTFNTSYSFSEGRFKHLRLGGGFQWGSRNIVGYARDARGNLDTSKPFTGAIRFSTDAFIGYSRMLYRGKVHWDVQLNLNNLLNDDPLFARAAFDDGAGNPVTTLRYQQNRFAAQLTNTFKF